MGGKSRFRVGTHLFECTIFGKNHIDKNVHMHLETRDKDLLGLYKIGPFHDHAIYMLGGKFAL